MLISRADDEGAVDTRKIKTSYSAAAGTAYVFFEKAKVPVENVMGGEGNGLKGACYRAVRRQIGRGPRADLPAAGPQSSCPTSITSGESPSLWFAPYRALTISGADRWVICCRIARYSRLMVRPSGRTCALPYTLVLPPSGAPTGSCAELTLCALRARMQYEETWKWAHLRKSQGA